MGCWNSCWRRCSSSYLVNPCKIPAQHFHQDWIKLWFCIPIKLQLIRITSIAAKSITILKTPFYQSVFYVMFQTGFSFKFAHIFINTWCLLPPRTNANVLLKCFITVWTLKPLSDWYFFWLSAKSFFYPWTGLLTNNILFKATYWQPLWNLFREKTELLLLYSQYFDHFDLHTC